MENLHRKALLGQMTRPPRPPGEGSAAPRSKRNRRDYTPSDWQNYFDKHRDIPVGESNVFRVYEKGSEGAVLFLLHGGGLSALSFACLANELLQACKCRVVALDLRGHGDSHTDDDYNLSMETQVGDVVSVVQFLYGDDPPPIVLMGHSMGGALAVHVAHSRSLPSLAGLIVVDVVEGSAMDALSAMHAFLRSQPKKFPSLPAAIEWACRTGQIRNVESARISMPSRLCPAQSAGASTSSEATVGTERPLQPEAEAVRTLPGISEGEPDKGATASACGASGASPAVVSGAMAPPDVLPQTIPAGGYVWRIDLTRTERYWEGWFKGLSSYFLDSGVPSFLILAGVDRLDKEMTIASMQGKFQMQILPQCGHCIHEDAPDKVAEVVSTFLIRYQLAKPGDNVKPRVPMSVYGNRLPTLG